MMPMVSLEMDDEDVLDMACPIPIDVANRPKYPYGTQIVLTDKELAKLGCDAGEAFVGGMIHIHAMARITSVSSTDTSDGKRDRVELQIEEMCIEGEDAENAVAETAMRKRNPLHDRS